MPLSTILLVEDDHLLHRALRRLLAWEGYAVLDGGPGEQVAGAELVVLGVGQGCPLEAVERLEQRPGLDKLPLLVVGGEPGLQQRLGSRQAPTAFLPRLYDGPELLATIRSFLPSRHPEPPSCPPERPSCHAERSEASAEQVSLTLRFAQSDKVGAQSDRAGMQSDKAGAQPDGGHAR